MIHLSKKEDYSIILVNELAKQYKQRLVPLSEIATHYSISLLFLRNLANELKHAGIIGAVEGKHGGYFLAKNPKELKIGEVLAVCSQKRMIACCPTPDFKEDGICDKVSVCTTGEVWRKLHKDFLEKIYTLSIKEFMHYK